METTDDKRSVVMSEVMPPECANFSGNVHGGHILMLLDQVAYVCAARYTNANVVTLSVDQVLFKKPTYVGELVTFYASVNHVGRSSMEIGIRVEAENLMSGEVRHTNTCFFTMVATDKNLKPIPAKKLTLNTETEKRRFSAAEVRRNSRLKS